MHSFTEFLHSLSSWLTIHPHLALLITFAVSLSESLAIIGTLVPGSITMTAVGVLAGSGVMRIDLTLLAATLGAVAGDSASYMLGYAFSDRLAQFWPFRRYPKWLASGKEYFNRHGQKSVLIGRFVGPLRSIIPVIAGMMRMNRWQFLLANVISAFGWAFLYVMPGVLIGAASTELSAEDATKLFALILILLLIVWLISLGIIKLIIRANCWLGRKLHQIWGRLRHQTTLTWLFKLVTPKYERNHYRTALLIIILLFCIVSSIILTILVTQNSLILSMSKSVYLFLQSIRTPFVDTFLIEISLIIKPLSLCALSITVALFAMYYHDWRLLRYWLSLLLVSTAAVLLVLLPAATPRPNSSICAINLAMATSLLTFVIFYLNKNYHHLLSILVQVLLVSVLSLAGISCLYLGDNWITSIMAAYVIGLSVSLAHWIFYRRIETAHEHTSLSIVYLCLILLLSTAISYGLDFQKMVRAHHPIAKQYVLSDNAWWSQQEPLLPVHMTNRTGHQAGIFNLQYVGSLSVLKNRLTNYGWKNQPNTFFNTLIRRAGGQATAKQLPLMPPLHLNKKPLLVMTYRHKSDLYVLTLWDSNYRLEQSQQPVWIGSIIASSISAAKTQNAFHPLLSALPLFQTHIMALPKSLPTTTPQADSPQLLLMKEYPVLPPENHTPTANKD